MAKIIDPGAKYLVSTDNWFVAPDGEQYKAAYGHAEIITTEEALGFLPIRPSTNWFMRIGMGDRSVFIAGCQIHYVVRSDIAPDRKAGTYKQSELGHDTAINKIYFAEE